MTGKAARRVWSALLLGSFIAPTFGQEPAPVVAPETAPTLERHERKLGVMGTELILEVYHADAAVARTATDAAIAELVRIEDMMTSWRDSPLTRLNAHAGQGGFEVPRELARLLARSFAVAELTGGAFDPTYASAGRLWDFKAQPPQVPSEAEIALALRSVGFAKVQIDLEQNRVSLPEGFRVGLGGIAKGYGVDRAMQVLMDHGIEHAMVNAGGDLKVLGLQNGEAWRIAVRHPRAKDRIIAMVPLANTCIVTSGDYERFFEQNGKRYHHILDPRTGMPASGAMSATVIAQDAAFADALATAMVVLGPERGLPIIEALPRVEAILVDMQGKVHASKGLADKITETSSWKPDKDPKTQATH